MVERPLVRGSHAVVEIVDGPKEDLSLAGLAEISDHLDLWMDEEG